MTQKLDSMYELTKTFENAITMVDEDGILTDEALEIIKKMEGDIVTKTGNIFGVKDFVEGQIELLKNSKKYLDKKKKVFEANLEKLRTLFSMGLDTVPFDVNEKTGKKTQQIKTPFGTAFYKFSEKTEIFPDEVEDKFKKEKTTLSHKSIKMSKEDMERLAKEFPEHFELTTSIVIDEEALKEAYDNGENPKGIKVEEVKTLNLRK